MADIKPAEVSAILRQELAGFDSNAVLEEIGSILQIGDGIARVYGLSNVEAGELVEFEETGLKGIVLNLEEDNVGIVLLGGVEDLNEGDKVKRTGRIASINVGEGLLYANLGANAGLVYGIATFGTTENNITGGLGWGVLDGKIFASGR